MRIVIVDTTLAGPLIGGAQTFLPSLLKGLAEQGHEIHIVSKGMPDERILKPIQNSEAILHTSLWKENLLVEDAAPVFAKWINDLEPDIYLVSVSPDIGWVVLPLLNPGIARLAIGHTDSPTFYLPAQHYQPFLTTVIGVSDAVCEYYIADCNFDSHDVEWIPYGVKISDVAPAGNEDGVLKMIYVGRLEDHQKRVSDLAIIARKLSKKSVKYHLSIIGDGPEKFKLKNDLKKEIEENKVTFYGWLNNDEVIKELRNAEVFVLTSAYEGFCIALTEAMANGCCPVVTDIRSGNKQLIREGHNGFLLKVGDVDGFVERLVQLQQDKSLLLQLRQSSWQTGRQYSIPKMVNAYEKYFHDAINKAKAKPGKPVIDYPLMESCRSKYPLWIRRIKKKIIKKK
jgi:glycosyltransferase involved in cell wall biosynthesis